MIPITNLSSSAYSCHEDCPMKYFIEYALKRRPPQHISAEKGNIVHKVLEILGLFSQNKDKDLVETDIGLLSPRSFSIVDIVYECAEQQIRSSTNQWKESDIKDCLSWVEKVLTYNEGEFNPLNNNILEIEKFCEVEIYQPWAVYDYGQGTGFLKLRGIIDQISILPNGMYQILDWKTGKRTNWITGKLKDIPSLYDDIQLQIYHYLIKQIYPDKNVCIVIYYINDGGPFHLCFNDEILAETEIRIRAKFEEIKNTTIPRLNKSWKCTKVCHYGKNTFENTDVAPIIERRPGQVTPEGAYMTICEQVKFCIENNSISFVLENFKKD